MPEMRERVAYLAEGHPYYRWMTIGEAVRFTRAFYRSWNDELLEQILDHFELPRRAKMRRLSNGQRAQVSLALAVAPDPELLILDDPTLGLDTVVRRDFLESMIQIIQRRGRTILFSSHILGDVERVADRIGILVDGVLRVDCPTDHFKQTIRKVVLDFASEPPECPEGPGLVGNWRVGNKLELIFVGYDDRQRQLAESLSPQSIEVVDLNLEDAFIAYTRGQKRSLPEFSGDTNDADGTRDKGAA
jgi:ABC-2 type transport system ATP-binding protein